MYHLDYETFSPEDLPKVGAFRYAEHPEAEILLCAVCKDDGPVYVWPIDREAGKLIEEISQTDDPIIAHNAQFEAAITKYNWEETFGVKPPALERWICTSVLARVAGLPPGLEQCANALGLDQKKDYRGKALIRKFCIPDKKTGKRTRPEDHPEDWQAFIDYCRQDVNTERAIWERLKPFRLKGWMKEAYHFDQRMNDRGIPIDVEALGKALPIARSALKSANQKFKEITGLSLTQTAKFTVWAKEHGYPENDLQQATIASVLQSYTLTSPKLIQALHQRQIASYAAVKKLPAMHRAMCTDGRVRGVFQFYGAGTGRWSGRLIQPQNYKRSTKESLEFFEDLKAGFEISLLYANPLDELSTAIRHFIKGPFVDADYSAIEGRLVCWLVGQKDAVEEYRKGVDRYVSMASLIHGRPFDEIAAKGGKSPERRLGKQAVLGCGYGMGVDKFLQTCQLYGLDFVDLPLADRAVTIYRESHDKVVAFWYKCDDAFRRCIKSPGRLVEVGPVAFKGVTVAGLQYVVIRLPSGRLLAYPGPKIEHGDITYWGQLPGLTSWGRVKLYGGKIVENITQAVAFDCMANGALEAERRGYPPVALIHDQALSENAGDPEEFSRALTTLPSWAEGLPLDAEAEIIPCYQ